MGDGPDVKAVVMSSLTLFDAPVSLTRRDTASSGSCSLPPPFVHRLCRRGGCQTQTDD